MKTLRKLTFLAMTIIILYAVSMNVQAAIRCTIGNVGYTKMQQAINAAKPGDVIVLKENVTTNYTMKIDKKKNLTIDFSGKKWMKNGGWQPAFDIRFGSKVTFRNAHIVSEGFGTRVFYYSKLTLLSGSISGNPGIQVTHDSIADIRGGTITSELDNVVHIEHDSTVRISGGTLVAGSGCDYLIWLERSSAELSGGTYLCKNVEAFIFFIDDSDRLLSITGGKYSPNNAKKLKIIQDFLHIKYFRKTSQKSEIKISKPMKSAYRFKICDYKGFGSGKT